MKNLNKTLNCFKAMLFILSVFLVSCDGYYRAQLIADLPQDQQYKVLIHSDRLDASWLFQGKNINKISDRHFSGFSKILTITAIGPGFVKVNLNDEFWNSVSFIEIIRISDGDRKIIKKEDVRVYKASDLDVIMYILIKE